MMAIFEEGETVRATTSTQGLVRGQEYVIEQVHERLVVGMLFVTYVVTAADDPRGPGRELINGHLLLERV